MENEDRSGRKRTLFRRNREHDDFDSRPALGSLAEEAANDAWVDVSVDAAQDDERPASAKKTASMFAPRQKWTDTWGDDAWDDEWRDPAFRRSSVPPVASPGPDQIDAWLDNDKQAWGDVTRETISKMGGDPRVADGKPGSTWDDSSSKESAPSNESALTNEPAPGRALSDIESAIEQALASVASAPIEVRSDLREEALAESPERASEPDLAPMATIDTEKTDLHEPRDLSHDFLPERSPEISVDTPELAVDQQAPISRRFRRSQSPLHDSPLGVTFAEVTPETRAPETRAPDTTAPETATPETGTLAKVSSPPVDIDLSDPVDPRSANPAFRGPVSIDLAPPDVTDAIELPTDEVDDVVTAAALAPGSSWDDTASISNDSAAKVTAAVVQLDPDTHIPRKFQPKLAFNPALDTALDPALDTARNSATSNDPDSTGELAMSESASIGMTNSLNNGEASDAFVDRISWIGSGVALIAAVRLLVLLWSGSRSADPVSISGESLSAVERIGRGFSEAGVVQGVLLIIAVALLTFPSLFGGRTKRIGTGLGLIVGTSTLGLIGAFLAYLSDERLADLSGISSGSNTMRSLATLIAAAGLSLVAWAAALRAIRSDED